MIGFRGRSRSRSRSPRRRDRSRSPRYSRSRSRSRSPAKRDKDSRSVSVCPFEFLDTSWNGKMLESVFVFRNKTLKFVLANRALRGGLVRFNVLIINSVWLKDSSSSFRFGFDLFESRKVLLERNTFFFWKGDVKVFMQEANLQKSSISAPPQPQSQPQRVEIEESLSLCVAGQERGCQEQIRQQGEQGLKWKTRATLPRRLRKKNFA